MVSVLYCCVDSAVCSAVSGHVAVRVYGVVAAVGSHLFVIDCVMLCIFFFFLIVRPPRLSPFLPYWTIV